MSYHTDMDEIVAANFAAGQYFFAPGAMQGFDTRLYPEVEDGKWFVISNKPPFPGSRRQYRLCRIRGDGTIDQGEVEASHEAAWDTLEERERGVTDDE